LTCFVPRRLRLGNSRAHFSAHRNCHTSINGSRARENARNEKLKNERLEKDWRELLTHATIVTDPENILWLTAKLEQQRKRESVRQPHRD
jgi:hypothetical protein